MNTLFLMNSVFDLETFFYLIYEWMRAPVSIKSHFIFCVAFLSGGADAIEIQWWLLVANRRIFFVQCFTIFRKIGRNFASMSSRFRGECTSGHIHTHKCTRVILETDVETFLFFTQKFQKLDICSGFEGEFICKSCEINTVLNRTTIWLDLIFLIFKTFSQTEFVLLRISIFNLIFSKAFEH